MYKPFYKKFKVKKETKKFNNSFFFYPLNFLKFNKKLVYKYIRKRYVKKQKLKFRKKVF